MRIRGILQKTLLATVSGVLIWLAISFVNWSFSPGDWNGFSRLLFALLFVYANNNILNNSESNEI